MRLALTCNFSPWSGYSGGAQRSTDALASALVRRGHDVTVVYTACRWARPVPPVAPPYAVRWASFIGLRATRQAPLRPLNAVTVAATLRALHGERPLDVVHAQGEEGSLARHLTENPSANPSAKGVRPRLVFTPRYPSYPNALRSRSTVTRAWLWAAHTKYPLVGVMLGQADAVCATSVAAAQALESAFGYPQQRAVVVPNAVEPRFFEVTWQGPTAGAPIVFFGRVEHDKGVDTLLRAARDIERPIWIVGRGALEGPARKLARELGMADRVRFEGWHPPARLADLLRESAAAVLPSRRESFGNAMAEALAAGVPLVTTRAGSIPEVTGDAATLVEPDSPRQLGRAIAALLADPGRATAMAAAGRERVRSRFSWDAVAEAYEAVYRGTA